MRSTFPGAVPEIPVSDIEAAVAYYERNLGFTLDWSGEDVGLAGISEETAACSSRAPNIERDTAMSARC